MNAILAANNAKSMRKEIIKIAFPSGFMFLLDVVGLAISTLFIGELGSNYISSMGVGLNYLILSYIIISSILYVGTNVQISQLYGAKKRKKVNTCFCTILFFSLIASIPLFFISEHFIGAYLHFMNLEKKTILLSNDFLNFTIYSVPFILIKNVIISALSATGDTKTPFYIKLFATLVNLVLSYILIFGFCGTTTSGIAGAGLANSISSGIELLILLSIIASNRYEVKFTNKIKIKYLIDAIRIGTPSGIERVLTFVAIILISKFLAEFGDSILAGSQIGMRVESFVFMPAFGFTVASMAITGQCIGAGNVELLKKYTYENLKISTIIMAVFSVVLIAFAPFFTSFFTHNSEAIRASILYLYAVGISQIPLIWNFVLDGVMRGSSRTKLSLLINCGSIWFFRILPIFLALKCNVHYEVIFIIIALETFVRTGIFYAVYKSIYR